MIQAEIGGFGETVSSYSFPGHPMPPNLDEVLAALEFLNHQCPECEPRSDQGNASSEPSIRSY